MVWVLSRDSLLGSGVGKLSLALATASITGTGVISRSSVKESGEDIGRGDDEGDLAIRPALKCISFMGWCCWKS